MNVQVVQLDEVHLKAERFDVTYVVAQNIFDPELSRLECGQRFVSKALGSFFHRLGITEIKNAIMRF